MQILGVLRSLFPHPTLGQIFDCFFAKQIRNLFQDSVLCIQAAVPLSFSDAWN